MMYSLNYYFIRFINENGLTVQTLSTVSSVLCQTAIKKFVYLYIQIYAKYILFDPINDTGKVSKMMRHTS